MYKIKGELGSGNFSRVRLASHELTQGAIFLSVNHSIFPLIGTAVRIYVYNGKNSIHMKRHVRAIDSFWASKEN